MKKIAALILTLCMILAAVAACAETSTYILYSLKNPDGETFTASDNEKFPFYAYTFYSDTMTAILYKNDAAPQEGTFTISPTDDEEVVSVDINFLDGDTLSLNCLTTSNALYFNDSGDWENVLLARADFPDETYVQTYIDTIDGVANYILSTLETPTGEVQTAETSESFPYIIFFFDTVHQNCLAHCIIDGAEQLVRGTYEVAETDNPETFALVVTLEAGDTITLYGANDDPSTLYVYDESTGDGCFVALN